MRIRQTNDLPGIARVGEDFLIAGETGIKNDFAAAARDGAGSASVKYAPVFEREYCGSVLNFRQCEPPSTALFFARFRRERNRIDPPASRQTLRVP